jgi:DivIVA domain-containing protein
MDSSTSASSILDTLRTVEFRLGLKGYNVDEVDEYLDKAAQEAEALQENLRQLNERLRQAGDRIAQLEKEKRTVPVEEPAAVVSTVPSDVGPSDETLQRTLILAQKFVDQVKRESEAEAAATVARAEETARAAVAAAEDAALKLQSESQRKVRDEVARLEATRTELAADVESMARHLESERTRLRDALSEILRWVDENVQPANSLIGAPPAASPEARPAPAAAPVSDPPTPVAAASPEAPSGVSPDDNGQPTLNLHAVTESADAEAPRPA